MPSSVVAVALHDFQENGEKRLTASALSHTPLRGYATPRRLILHTPQLARRPGRRVETLMGPPVKVSFDAQGHPTPAASGFAKSVGVALSTLKRIKTEKGEYLSAEKTIPAKPTSTLLQEIVPEMIAALRFPKEMRWNSAVSFIRPIRWLVVMYNSKVVPCTFSGVVSGNISYGHRLISPQPFRVSHFAAFEKEMRKRSVVICPTERYTQIKKGIEALAKKAGGRIEEDDPLLWHAAYATEYPVALCGAFDRSFLAVPSEVLITAMKEHQGYFPLCDTPSGNLLPHFIAISNNKDKQKKIQLGNERVLRARLSDAQFYFEEDRKVGLTDRLETLKGISFQEGLGTLYDKTERLIALSQFMAKKTGLASCEDVAYAARVCKCDLTTGIVREFPSLQGVMGRILAGDPKIGKAVEEHYLPRSPGDRLPATPAGQILAVADKLDTLVGCFGIGLIPTGSEDPYALRRQGMGVVQILSQPSFQSLLIEDILQEAMEGYRTVSGITLSQKTLIEAASRFLNQRLDAHLQSYNIRYDMIDAVMGGPPRSLYSTVRLAQAISDFSKQPLFNPLLTCYKRVTRILPDPVIGTLDLSRLTSGADRALYEAALNIGQKVQEEEYDRALEALTTLYHPLDRFFKEVLVMDPNEAIQRNNLLLLRFVQSYFLPFGDFSKIQEGSL